MEGEICQRLAPEPVVQLAPAQEVCELVERVRRSFERLGLRDAPSCQLDIGATEVVPGAATVLLDGLVDPAATAALVEAWALPPATDQAEGPLVTIPVVYDGPDLDFVADHWSVSTEEANCALISGGTMGGGSQPVGGVPKLLT